jgi:hypothetical protein
MYRYRPPKSSVWGHKLQRIPIARVRDFFWRFMDTGVAEYRFQSANLWTSQADVETVARYERAAGISAEHGRIANLTYEQSESCLAILLEDEEAFRAKDVHLSLWQTFAITKWKYSDSAAATNSILGVQYDIWPHLATTLEFGSVEQFEHVKSLLNNIGLCTLNEKHLKPIKGQGKAHVQ